MVIIETEGMEQRDPALVKGETVTLKGKQAEIFVRFRDIKIGHSALFRMDQQQYIKAFFHPIRNSLCKQDLMIVHMLIKFMPSRNHDRCFSNL